MKNEEIVRALRCISTAGSSPDCEHCPYWMEESVPAEMRDMVGEDVFHSCDIDRVGLDGADLIEKLTDRCARYAEEIAVAQDRTRWIPVTERLPEANEFEEVGGMSKVVLGIAKNDSGFSLFNPCLCVYLSDGRWIFRGKPVTVTHWMPLPEPPEEER